MGGGFAVGAHLVVRVLDPLHGNTSSLGQVAVLLIVLLHLSSQLEEQAVLAEPVDVLVRVGINVVQALAELGIELLDERRQADGNVGNSGQL